MARRNPNHEDYPDYTGGMLYGYGINQMTPDPYFREDNPRKAPRGGGRSNSILNQFEKDFGGRITNRDRSGDWYVWDVVDAGGIHTVMGELKDAGFYSIWVKHGKLGALRSHFSGSSSRQPNNSNSETKDPRSPQEKHNDRIEEIAKKIEANFPVAVHFDVYEFDDSDGDDTSWGRGELIYEGSDLRKAIWLLFSASARRDTRLVKLYVNGNKLALDIMGGGQHLRVITPRQPNGDNLGEEVDDIVEEIETKMPAARLFGVYDSYTSELIYKSRNLQNAVIVLLKEQKRGNEIEIHADGVLVFSTP